MFDKSLILDNIETYSVVDLVRNISAGIITMADLDTLSDDKLPAEKRADILRLVNSDDLKDWNEARSANTIEAINKYLREHPGNCSISKYFGGSCLKT